MKVCTKDGILLVGLVFLLAFLAGCTDEPTASNSEKKLTPILITPLETIERPESWRAINEDYEDDEEEEDD